ncbi:DUF6233 domain-containing protein [Streptomyces sp. NPDC007095]|uniref:DUF6233 domain-containing protein n=1 Tax=Streptomyces sp. NPDC007095 TaxID=3154482 RepID=UPI000C709AD7
MNDDLPPDLPRLRTLETWLILSLTRVQRHIADIEQREAERRHGQQVLPPIPDWLLEVGIGSGKSPVAVHVGGCHMAGGRVRGIPRDQALRAITGGVDACSHCRPDSELGILD